MNALVNNNSISSKCYINIYQAAADNYETIVPRGSILTPRYHVGPGDYAEALPVKAGYYPVYVGTWHSLPDVAMLRYGPVSDHVCQFDKKALGEHGFGMIWMLLGTRATYKMGAQVMMAEAVVTFLDPSGYIYGAVYAKKEEALEDLNDNASGATLTRYLTVTESGDYWTPSVPKGKSLGAFTKQIKFGKKVKVGGVRPEMELRLGECVESMEFGRLHTGESHADLKDYCRRFSLVASMGLDIPEGGPYSMISIPVLPQGGLVWGDQPDTTGLYAAKRAVDYLEVISSGFAFVRGGVRYKIFLEAAEGTRFFCGHNPDIRPPNGHIMVDLHKKSEKEWVFDDWSLPRSGEAMMVFGAGGAMEVEIPQYSAVDRHWAFSPFGVGAAMNSYKSLGFLNIGVLTNRAAQKVYLHIFQSAADDWSLSLFQGVPKMSVWNPKSGSAVVRSVVKLKRPQPCGDSEWSFVRPEADGAYGEKHYEYWGQVLPGLQTTIPTTTKFVRTVVDIFDPAKEPSILSSGDPRYGGCATPLFESVEHHLSPLKCLDRNLMAEVIESYRNLVMAKCEPTGAVTRVLSLQEAVCGIPGREGFAGLDLSTSAGFMFKNFCGFGKTKFVRVEAQKLVYIHPILQRSLLMERKSRVSGTPWPTIFVDCLKDELLLSAKVRAKGKTRVFSMSPLSYTIRARQLFQEFCAAFQVNRMELEHAVGINPDGVQWTELAKRIGRFGNGEFGEGDYSKFGDRLPSELVKAAYEIIIEWCDHHIEDFPLIEAHCMAQESIFAFHLAGSHLYRVLCGQPSGNPLTVIINSMVNCMLVRYAYLLLRKEKEGSFDLSKFSKEVALFVYGDDLLYGVAKSAASWFVPSGLQRVFERELGLGFTGSDKSAKAGGLLGLSKVSFLKRNFLKHPKRRGEFLSPIDLVSVFECCLWKPKGFGMDLDVQVCQDSARLMYGHGPERFREHLLSLRSFWEQRGVVFECPSWQTLDHKVFEKGEALIDLARGMILLD